MESGSSNQMQENEDISNSSNKTISRSKRVYDPHHVPISLVAKIMRKTLPRDAKISDEVKEIIQEAVTQFIRSITTEANKHSHDEKRMTIGAEDLLFALEHKGFKDYLGPLSLFLHRYRQSENPATYPYSNNPLWQGMPRPQPPPSTLPLPPTSPPPPPPQTQPQGLPQLTVTNNEQSFVFPPVVGASEFEPLGVGMFPNFEYQPLPSQSPAPPVVYNHSNDMGFPYGDQAMSTQRGMGQFTNMSPSPQPQGYDPGMSEFTNLSPTLQPQGYDIGMDYFTNMSPPPPPQGYGPGMDNFTSMSPSPQPQGYDPRMSQFTNLSPPLQPQGNDTGMDHFLNMSPLLPPQGYGLGMDNFINMPSPPPLQGYNPGNMSTYLSDVDQETIQNYGSLSNDPHYGYETNHKNDGW